MHDSQVATISLIVEKCHLKPTSLYPLHILATKYSTNGSSNITEQDGYTLILTHATGLHKETWEVTVKHLLGLCSTRGSSYRVKEIYSIENPNHGESALLNADVIKTQYKNSWPTTEYLRAIQMFLSAGPHRGARVDFSKRKLVGIGHSVGAVALILSQTLPTRIPWTSVIIIGPSFSPSAQFPGTVERFTAMQRWVWLRRDTWASKKHAFKDLQETRVFDQWDSRVLKLYVEHALSAHPASKIPPPHTFKGVVTSICKEQEAACYSSGYLIGKPLEPYWRLCAEIPVHLVWSDQDEIILANARELLSKPNTESGSFPASVRVAKDAGHMLIQQKPVLVADYIHETLSSMNSARAVL